MRSFILALISLFTLVGANAQTDVQFQAHLPFTATQVTFSAYIADSKFNEDSRLNTDALWFIENKVVSVSNGMINILLEKIPTSVFSGNFDKIYVYSYVNGQPLGKLPFHKLPYALIADSSDISGRAYVANFAQDARFAEKADTAVLALQANTSFRADTATYSVKSNFSRTSDTAVYARNAGYAVGADGSRLAQHATRADRADTSIYALTSGVSFATDFVNENGVNTLSIQNKSVVTEKLNDDAVTSPKIGGDAVQNRHISDGAVSIENLAGSATAQVGSYLTKGQNGISWDATPHHRTSSVQVYTQAPSFLATDVRWVVSRVAVDYNLSTVQSPTGGQLVTIYNGSTANVVTLKASTWSIDTGLDLVIPAGQSRTIWWSGFNWVVIA